MAEKRGSSFVIIVVFAILAILFISYLAGAFSSFSFQSGAEFVGQAYHGRLDKIQLPTCSDTDYIGAAKPKVNQNTFNPNLFGKITYSELVTENGKAIVKVKTEPDACKDKIYLKEWSCQNYDPKNLVHITDKLWKMYQCPFGCDVKNGVCINGQNCNDGIKNGDETGTDCGGKTCKACPVKNNCKDSDGSDYFGKGTVTTDGVDESGNPIKASFNDYCKKDAQGNSTMLLEEQVCNDKGAAESEYDCTADTFCELTFSGAGPNGNSGWAHGDTLLKGKSGTVNGHVVTFVQTNEALDSCNLLYDGQSYWIAKSLNGEIGKNINGVSLTVTDIKKVPKSLDKCDDGACIKVDYCKDFKELTPEQAKCLDKAIEPVDNQVESKCPFDLQYYYCSETQKLYSSYLCWLNNYPELKDQLQACTGEVICTDPDGYNISIKTTVTGISTENKSQIINVTDLCNPIEGKDVLYEATCLPDNTISTVFTHCPAGEICYDGACSQQCIDPDKTYDPDMAESNTYSQDSLNIQTTVKGIDTDGDYTQLTDYCYQSGFVTYLAEGFCKDPIHYEWTGVKCQNACINGACLVPECAQSNYQFSNAYEFGKNNLFYNQSINQIDPLIGSTELPLLFKDQQFIDNKGTNQKTVSYSQYLKFTNKNTGVFAFTQDDNVPNANTAGPFLFFSDSSNNYAWNYTVTFKDKIALDCTSLANFKADLIGTKITIMNKKYTIIDADAVFNVAGIIGTCQILKITLQAGDGTTIELNKGKEIMIDNKKITDATGWYAESSFINNDLLATFNGFTIAVRPDSDKVYLASGDSLIDPVFGAFKIFMGKVEKNPAEKIKLEASDKTGVISFTTIKGHELKLNLKAVISLSDKSNVVFGENDNGINGNPAVSDIIYLQGDTCVAALGSNITDCKSAEFLVSDGPKNDGHLIKISKISLADNKISFNDLATGIETNDLSFVTSYNGASNSFALPGLSDKIILRIGSGINNNIDKSVGSAFITFNNLGFGCLPDSSKVQLQTQNKANITIYNNLRGNVTSIDNTNAIFEGMSFSEYDDGKLFSGTYISQTDFVIDAFYNNSPEVHSLLFNHNKNTWWLLNGKTINIPKTNFNPKISVNTINQLAKVFVSPKGTEFYEDDYAIDTPLFPPEANRETKIVIKHPLNTVYAHAYIMPADEPITTVCG